MNRLKKLKKYTLRLLLTLLAILVLFSLLIQLPPVQSHLTQRLAGYLSNKLQTEVRIASIRLRLPKSLVLKGVYVEDQQKDTLLNVSELALNFRLNKLLKKRIQLDKFTLDGGKLTIYNDASGFSNYAFIGNAFGSNGDTTVVVTDQEPSAWTFTFDQANISLRNIQMQYSNIPEELAFGLDLESFFAAIRSIDLEKNNYEVESVKLTGSNIDFHSGRRDTATTTEAVPMAYQVQIGEVEVERLDLNATLANQQMGFKLEKMGLYELDLTLNENNQSLSLPAFFLENSRLRYDDQNAPAMPAGFDPAHIDLSAVNMDIDDINYQNQALSADIRNLSGRDGEAFVLQNAQTKIRYAPDSVWVDNFRIQTSRSILQSKKNVLRFGKGGMASEPENWQLVSAWDIEQLSTTDMVYFYPALQEQSFFRNERKIKSKGSLSGSLKNLSIDQFRVQDRDLFLDVRGDIAHVTDPEKVQLDLLVRRLGSSRQGLLAWLPEGMLPDNVQLADQHYLQGHIRGGLKQLRVQMQAGTRRGPIPIVSHLSSNIKLEQLTDLDRLRFDIELDSFYLSRSDLLAYLPPDLLPETVLLPESFSLQGKAAGAISGFTTDLRLQTQRGNHTAFVELAGRIDSLLKAGVPTVDLSLALEGFNRQELSALLPDSLLAYPMQAPDLDRLIGTVKGNLDSLGVEMAFGADIGSVQLRGNLLDQKKYDLSLSLSAFQPALLFVPEYLDSLLGFSFAPLDMSFSATGIGFDTSASTRTDLQLNIYRTASVIDSGLVLKVDLVKQSLSAGWSALENGLNLDGDLRFDFGNDIKIADLAFQVGELDVKKLGMGDIPFKISGSFDSGFQGSSPDTLSGQLLAKEWIIEYDSTTQVIDSLLFQAKMDNGENTLQLTSDLLNAHMDGSFQFPRLVEALQQQLAQYLNEEAQDSLVGNTTDRFEFKMDICRPEVFTMGIVPGLQELKPAKLNFQYDNRRATMNMFVDMPHIKWQDISLDMMTLEMTADADAFQYQLALRNVDLQQVARVPATRWEGRFAERQLTTALIALDEKEQNRFLVKTYLQFLGDTAYRIKFDPRQLLDYQWWEVTADNELLLQDDQISVQDWRLFRGEETIELLKMGKDRLRILFQKLDLDLIANVLDQEAPYLGGIMNGNINIDQPLGEVETGMDLQIDSLVFFDARLGNLSLNTRLDQEMVDLKAQLLGEGNHVNLEGNYTFKPGSENMDFRLDSFRLNLPSLEPLALGYLEDLNGVLAGGVRVSGVPDAPLIRGDIRFDRTAFDVGLLNTRLRLGNQPIVFDEQGISFQELELFDPQNKRGVLTGTLLTDNYQDFELKTDIKADDFEVLNTSSTDNDLYYGKLIVDATARLRGNIFAPEIEIYTKPQKGSSLTYVYLAGTPQVDDHEGIVEFINLDEMEEPGVMPTQLIEGSEELNMKVVVKMEITDDLTFKTITNPLTNDYFEGKAAGSINFTQFPDGRMELTGRVEMTEGRYLFTYQEVVRRAFTVAKGSSIRWQGDPLNPELDMKVLYEVETSPFPLLASFNENTENLNANRKETFQVELAIGGTPTQTEISTAILYPEIMGNSNQAEIKTSIQRINQDASRQNTQAFALILFNGFLGASAKENEFSINELDVGSNIGNLVTQQLNNLANRYIKFVELDIDLENYEKNSDGGKKDQADFRVSLRKQFLNDRLSISLDGVASAQTDLQAANTTYFLDNLTFEYDLTPDGRFRIKMYNRRDYDDLIGGNSLKVGGALVFSQDFNEVRLFGKRK